MTARELAAIIEYIRERDCNGAVSCCLHIVCDDDNLEDGSVQFCLGYALEQGHSHCAAAAAELLRHGRHWRYRVGQYSWGFQR